VAPPVMAPPKSFFARLAGAIFSPGETFEDIARKPDVLMPLLLFVLIGYACSFITIPRMDMDNVIEQQHAAMRAKNPQMQEKDFETIDRMTRAFAKVVGWIGPVLGVVSYLILAGVFLLAFRLFGGQGTFVQSLSATLYAWVPLVLFSILMTIIIAARGTWDPSGVATLVKSNPAFLVEMKEQPVLYSLLSSFDVFTFWTLALLSLFSRAKSAILVFSIYFAYVFVKLGFAAMGAARMKG
jgi:hypothetical protein